MQNRRVVKFACSIIWSLYNPALSPSFPLFQLMRELGKSFGYEPIDSKCTEAPAGKKTMVWTLVKEA